MKPCLNAVIGPVRYWSGKMLAQLQISAVARTLTVYRLYMYCCLVLKESKIL